MRLSRRAVMIACAACAVALSVSFARPAAVGCTADRHHDRLCDGWSVDDPTGQVVDITIDFDRSHEAADYIDGEAIHSERDPDQRADLVQDISDDRVRHANTQLAPVTDPFGTDLDIHRAPVRTLRRAAGGLPSPIGLYGSPIDSLAPPKRGCALPDVSPAGLPTAPLPTRPTRGPPSAPLA